MMQLVTNQTSLKVLQKKRALPCSSPLFLTRTCIAQKLLGVAATVPIPAPHHHQAAAVGVLAIVGRHVFRAALAQLFCSAHL
jgi:hypothetical protein